MNQDHKDLLSAFNARGVRYMIVGGYAVIFHFQPRFTKDIDIFIQADPSNAEAVYEALRSFGASLEGIRRRNSPTEAIFFALGAIPTVSISFLIFPEWNSSRLGNTGLKRLSIMRKVPRPSSSLPRT